MKTLGSFVIVTLLMLFSLAYPAPALGGDAIVSWDANSEPDQAGYKLYYGTASGSYGAPIDVGNQTTYTITDLGPGTYYFAATAYDTSGSESGFSNEASKTFGGASPGVLVVSPGTGLSASGDAGGPFSPVGKSYTLTNTGGTTINYTISKKQSWVSLSGTSGSLAPGASTSITVSINNSADSLSANTYSDTVSFTNTTNGDGNASRSVSLTVNATSGVLVVSPGTGLSASGDAGGPFSPVGKSYTLTNTGGTTINYTISKKQSWVSLSRTSGSLTQGASTSVVVSINSSANSLNPGTYSDTVTFTNTTNGNGNTSRSASVSVASPGSAMNLTLTPSADTYLNINNEVNITQPVLNTYTWPDNKISNAILMKFDLSTIPQGSSIQSATLNLYLVESDTTSDPTYTISVHKIINNNPDLTKATGYSYDGQNSWTPNTCCYHAIPLAQADIAAAEDNQAVDKINEYKTWTVTQMVQDWVNNPTTNFGMLINSDPLAATDSNRFFSSSEHPQADQWPKLDITYSTQEGIPAPPTGLTVQIGFKVTQK